jgi:hypothetical protein
LIDRTAFAERREVQRIGRGQANRIGKRTGIGETVQMLEAPLTRVGRLFVRHPALQMPCEEQPVSAGGTRQGKECFARHHLVHFDEIGSEPGERIDRGARLFRGPNDEMGESRRSPLDVWPRGHDAGAGERASANSGAPPFDRGQIAAHIPNPGHPVRNEEPQQRLTARHRRVDVHIPEAGDDELAGGVDDPAPRGNRHRSAGTDGHDSGPVDYDGAIADRHRIGHREHGGVDDRDRWRLSNRLLSVE